MRFPRFWPGLIVLPALCAGPCVAGDEVADRVLEILQDARRSAGAPPLERRADLDAVARSRAERVAVLPHEERLRDRAPLADDLQRFDVQWYRRAATHMEMVRGYERPETGLASSWRRVSGAWSKATSPDFDLVGIATERSEDGWVVLVAVLIAELPAPPDATELEDAVLAAVNRERESRGIPALEPFPKLAAVARAHSRDMAERGYLSHVSPEGLGPADRVERAGIVYARVAENIHWSRHDPGDPVEAAIRNWLQSPGHREAMLDPLVTKSGVGASVNADGSIHLTQLFLH